MPAGLTGFVLPLAVTLFLAVAAAGGMLVIWWDRAIRRRRLRLARALEAGGRARGGRGKVAPVPEVDAFNRARRASGGGLPRLVGRILPNRAGIQRRIERAGLRIGLVGFLILVLCMAGLYAIAAGTFFGMRLPLGLGIGLVLGYATVFSAIGYLGHRRSEAFLKQLPDAIDIMVRSVRVGLPVLEGIAVVREEIPDPLGGEFRTIRDQVQFGATLEQALWTIAQRIDRAEFNFLVISVAVQRETGGNLTEALENLSRILRQREQMKLKVRALSSEARASAYILGALPFIMGLLVFLMNPGYLDALFLDPRGHFLLGGGLGSMAVGVLVMAKMVRFRI